MPTFNPYTVATLPPAGPNQGSWYTVTDATLNPATDSGALAVGGGTTRTRVISDGVNWRVTGWTKWSKSPGSSGAPDTNFFNNVVAAGGTVSAGRKTLYTSVFNTLASANVLGKLDRLGIFGAENVPAGRVDLITGRQITPINGPTFTVDQGYSSNGTTQYLLTDAVPGSLTNFQQDSASFGVGTLTARVVGVDGVILGTAQNSGGSGLWLHTTGAPGVTFYVPNTTSVFANGLNWAQTDTKGFWHGNRSGSITGQLYRNGASLVSGTVSTSAAPLPYAFIVCAWRNTDNVSVYAYDTGIVSAYFIGSSMTATDAAILASTINTYMAAIGNPLFANLITQQDLSNVYWTRPGTFLNPAPSTLCETGTFGNHGFELATAITRTAGVSTYRQIIDLKPFGAAQWMNVGLFNGTVANGASVSFNCVTGASQNVGSFGGWTVAGSSITPIGGGTYRCIVDIATDAVSVDLQVFDQITSPDASTFNFTGAVTDGFIVTNIWVYRIA